jgi:hypothetical protein
MKPDVALENNTARQLGAYALAAVTAVVGIGCWVGAREALLTLMRAVSTNRYAVGAVDKFGFIVFGIVWLALVYVSAHFHGKAVPRRRVWRTFLRATGMQAAFLVLALAVYLISAQVLISRLASP